MSANLYWRPVDKGQHRIDTGAPSAFMDTLAELTGGQGRPWILDREHLPGLRALAKACRGEKGWAQLVAAIEEHGAVELTARH